MAQAEPPRLTRCFPACRWNSATGWVTVVTVWIAGCSLYDFGALSREDRSRTIGTSAGSGPVDIARAGGSPVTEGGVNAGGAAMTTPTNTKSESGGAPNTTNLGIAGMGAAAGGIGTTSGGIGPTSGGTSGIRQTIPCPAYDGSGGLLLTPPSNDFEADLGGWTRFAGDTGVSRVDGAACEGSGYLTCEGATRVGVGSDGPAIDVLRYMVPGHTYDVSAVVRFSPASAPLAQRKIGLSQEVLCEDGTAKRGPVQHTLTTSDWVRVRNTTPIKFPPKGCLNVTRMRFHVETSEEEGSLSIDMDDFRLIDTTDTTAGTGGTGGSGGSGGSGVGSAGVAGGAT